MKGLILAGGFGTRLRPITYTLAKQLVPIMNKPILFYGIEALAGCGITEIGVIVGSTKADVIAAVGDGSRFGVSITYIEQDQPRGLAHAVQIAEPFLGSDAFIMYLGDNVIREDLAPVVRRFCEEKPNAEILLTRVPDPQCYGVAELREGQVVRVVEKPATPPSDLAIIGVYLFDYHVFDAVKAIRPSWRGELEITDAIQWLIDAGLNVRSHVVAGWWKDTGKVEDMLEANRVMLSGIHSRIDGDVEASDLLGNVIVERGAKVIRSVVRGPAIIGPGARIEDAYVGPFTAIGPDVTIRATEIEYSIVLDGSRISEIEGRIEGSLVGKNVTIYRTARPRAHTLMLGDGARVGLV
jgi:glucose-1-phosphate thymidylyltransferase